MALLFFGLLLNVIALILNIAVFVNTGNPINLVAMVASGACIVWLAVLGASDY